MAMKAIVLQCLPGSRFHFGKHAPDDDTALNDSDELAHSDTVFAALVTTYAQIFGDADELVEAFSAGHVNVSSMFYCIKQKESYTWLLPKPVCFNLFDADDYKSFRGIRFISKKVWETIKDPAQLVTDIQYQLFGGNQFALMSGELVLDEKQRQFDKFSLANLITLPKVRVRDNPKDRGIYQLTITEIADNSNNFPGISVHFYFLLDDDELSATVKQKLYTVIEALAWSGIGAERSTIGKIEKVEIIDDWKINLTDEGKIASLSLFAPVNDDGGKLHYYKFLLRGGRRLGNKFEQDSKNHYLKTVRMIAEGAILEKNCKGQLADVSTEDDQTYLRHGKPLGIPVPLKWIPTYGNNE